MISVENLCKSFDHFVAVDNLNFTIGSGDVVGFLGPNGAGKSTTMKMLTGFLSASSGEIKVNDLSVNTAAKQIQHHLGYLPEGAPAYSDMTPFQFLHFIADIRGLRGKQKKDSIAKVVEQIELASVLDKPIENLSKGYKRRVGLAQAILHDPEILILDEPTDGLDPNQKYQVRQLIKNLSEDKIVIISTHILEEVTAVCNRVMIIAEGRLKFDDTPQALLNRSRYQGAIRLTLSEKADLSALSALSGVQAMEEHTTESGTEIFLFVDPKQSVLSQVNRLIDEQQLPVETLSVEQGRLDEVFRQLTQHQAEQKEASHD
jgi:ABC-2 type transport system ATP-binding protein